MQLIAVISWAKERIIQHILGDYSDQRSPDHQQPRKAVKPHAPWHWQLVQLLYFGQSDKDWSYPNSTRFGTVRY